MFPYLMPNATMGGNLSLLSLLMSGTRGQGPYAGAFGQPNPDRSDQTARGNQPDYGNSMAPPGQQPQGGPDNSAMSPYDANTVSPSPASGWNAPSWMRMMANYRSPTQQQQRSAQTMGLLGLSMLQPRQQPAPQPYPWI